MNRATVIRTGLIGVLAAALIGLLVWWWLRTYEWKVESIDLPPRGEAAYNPLYALKLALQKDGRSVDARQRLDVSGHPLRPADTVLLLGDPRALVPSEVDALLDWVERGGHLIVRTPPPGVVLAGEDVPLLDRLGVVAMDADPFCYGLQVGKHEHHVEFCYGRRFYFGDEHIETSRRWGDDEQGEYGYARVLRGAGSVDVVADLDFLANDALEDPQHAALARQLLQPNWAESGNSKGTFHLIYRAEMPSLLDLLFEHAWRVLLAAAIALLLWLWMRAERFGPLRSPSPPDRRSLLEHIQASGDHLHRYGRRATLYAAVHEAFMRRLRRRDPFAAALEGPAQIDALVKRTGWPLAEVEAALRYPRPGDARDFVLRIAKLLKLRSRL